MSLEHINSSITASEISSRTKVDTRLNHEPPICTRKLVN